MSYFLTSQGIKLHYEIKGEGRPLLFLHGWGMCSMAWRYQIEELSGDYRTVTLDFRGHGGSDPSEDHSFEALSDDIKELIEGLSLGRVSLVGWSMGGSVALLTAVRYPKLIDTLTLVDATPKFTASDDFPHGQPAATVKRLARQIESDRERAMMKFSGMMFEEEGITEEIWQLVTAGPWPSTDTLIGYLDTLGEADLRGYLQRIDLPTMIFHGLRDRISFHEAAVYMADRIKRVRLETHHDEGHAPFLTLPNWFNTELRGFLDEFGTDNR